MKGEEVFSSLLPQEGRAAGRAHYRRVNSAHANLDLV